MGWTHFDKVSGVNGIGVGAAGSEIGINLLTGTATFDPGSILDGDMEAVDVTVTGAVLGDVAIAGFSLDVQDLVLSASVTAADTVTVVFANNTGGAVDLASGTVRAYVISTVS